LIAAISTYNSMDDGLEGCVASLSGKCDRLIVADGYYETPRDDKRYPYRGPASSDGTEQYVRGLSNSEWIPAPERYYLTQVEKMNVLTSRIPDGEWVLWIDPDERLVGNPNALVRSVEYVPVKVIDLDGQVMYYIRLLRKTRGMVWTDWCTVKSPAGVEVGLYLGNISEQVYISHSRRFRSRPN